MASVKKVAMIILMQQDLEAAVGFYKQLGLVLVFHIKERWAEFDLQGIRIGLCPTDKPVTEYRTGLVLEVDDVALLYASFGQKGSFVGKPTQAAEGTVVSLKDPGGNIIDLYQSFPTKTQELFGDIAQKVNSSGCCQSEKSIPCCKAG